MESSLHILDNKITTISGDLASSLNSNITSTSGSIIAYVDKKIEVFDAGILLDFSGEASGDVPNLGTWSDVLFKITGSVSKGTVGEADYFQLNPGGVQLKAWHDNTTGTASYSSCNATDGSASFTIVDTANNLQELYQYTGRTNILRPFKIDVGCSGPFYMSGYIGGITKVDNTYTISVYSSATGSTRNWHKFTVNSWTGTSVIWRIYPRYCEIDHSGSNRVTQMMWYWPNTDASGYQYIMGKGDWLNNGDDLFISAYLLSYSNTTGSLKLDIDGVNLVTLSSECLTPNRWHHLCLIKTSSLAQAYVNGAVVMSASNSATSPLKFGMTSFGCSSTGAILVPSGSRIAFCRFWQHDIDAGLISTIYNYERNLMGLRPNH